jgi:hypothetical protein
MAGDAMNRVSLNLAAAMGFVTKPHGCLVDRIVSDGQSGVARGALDAAIALGVSHGGHCAAERLADDGPLDARYEVHAIKGGFGERVAKNIQHSHGTLLVTFCAETQMDGRTKHARDLSKLRRRAMVHLQMPNSALDISDKTVRAVRHWLKRCSIRILHVTGRSERRMSEPVRDRPLRYDLMRDPACFSCGIVDPAYGYRPDKFKHVCNPTLVQMQQIGQKAVEQIGCAIRDAMAVFS